LLTTAASARKRARRKDVKAIVAQLQKPAKEKLQKQIEANFEFATEKLMSIANAELDLSNIKPSDKIRAIEVLAKMHGWNAPEKREVNAEAKIERIELVIVDPPSLRRSPFRSAATVPPFIRKVEIPGGLKHMAKTRLKLVAPATVKRTVTPTRRPNRTPQLPHPPAPTR
jgi:hypothetical protein